MLVSSVNKPASVFMEQLVIILNLGGRCLQCQGCLHPWMCSKLVTAHAVQLIHFRMHMHLQMQSQAAHVQRSSGLNSAAATLSSLSVAVHTHILSSCAVDNFLHDHSRCVPLCHPSAVVKHVDRMKKNYTWRIDVEIC